jgi:transposase-like protein
MVVHNHATLRRLTPVDADDDIDVLNGFAVLGEVRAFTLSCPACGAWYEVKARDRHSRIFNHRTQRFRCRRCRFCRCVSSSISGSSPTSPTRHSSRGSE